MASRSLLDPESSYPLPASFTVHDYLETEREFWALFPETEGKRVNFCQVGLTAQLYTEVSDTGDDLKSNEVYFLMPCADRIMRPVRMQAVRHLTVSEYRMSRMTALKLGVFMQCAAGILQHVHHEVLGSELLAEEEN
jgi:hypothetical protein